MIPVYYGSLFIISLLCSAIYVYIWHKHFDVNFTLIFTLIPIANLGYLTSSLATNAEEFIVGTKISYIGGSFLQLFMMLSIFNICQVEVTKIQRVCLYVISALVYLSVVSIGYTGFFYKNYSYALVGSTPVLVKEYGWMHTVFYLLVVLFFLAGIITIAHAWLKKSQIPRTIVSLLVFPDIVCVAGFIFGKALGGTIELVPFAYVLADIIYLIIASRFNLYDVSNTVIDSMTKQREIGYISFDFNYRYLGSNDTAKILVPDLKGLHVDSLFGYKPSERRIRHFLESFKKDEKNNSFVHTLKSEDGNTENDKIYNVNVNYLYDDNCKKGYIVTFTDDTANRKYIRLLDSYNETLKEEVEEKTKSIVEMHNNLIMGLAKMVESRDNSTGGHITRTSEGVRILVDEICKEGKLKLSEEFCKNVIKAAPMHDLGKIAVDDAILRKPGKFTDEEYEKMKEHAAEGARVIHEVLLHTDDESFKTIAENVAHYHHERWDGSGYPEKLSGESIPLEARIMAIADVYDALVSKRVYKEAFDFERADRIIMEGMGTQFDPSLQSIYEMARPRLEEYYRAQ